MCLRTTPKTLPLQYLIKLHGSDAIFLVVLIFFIKYPFWIALFVSSGYGYGFAYLFVYCLPFLLLHSHL